VPFAQLPQANQSEYDDKVTMLEPENQPSETTAGDNGDVNVNSGKQASESAAVEINWLYHELSNDLLAHVNGSSFLELLCLAYFLGADDHLTRRHDRNAGKVTSPLLKRLLHRLGDAEENPERLENCRRLLNNNSLLRQFFHEGQHALSCHLSNEINIQGSLQQLVRQYAHFSLMDLNQFNITPYADQPAQQQYRPLKIGFAEEKSSLISYFLAIFLFIGVSAGGSYLLLHFLFPEVLDSLFK